VEKRPISAVILAGGQSSRLFPFNKVLSDLTGSGQSLIQQAYQRAKKLSKHQTYILTMKEMVPALRRQLKLPASRFLVDPVRRGTWPAILWAMAHLRRQNPDAVLAVLTGDHVIRGDRAFQRAFRHAVAVAQSNSAIVMMGIHPIDDPHAWRGFGCFRADDSGRVTDFEEKPDSARAQELIRTGGWRWNSGMFFFRISTAEMALARLQPEMHRVYVPMASALALGKKEDAAFLFQDFPAKIPHPLDPGHYVDNSIDFAILTPLVSRADPGLEAFAVGEVGFRWTDLGQWDALRQVLKADRHGNIRVGHVVSQGGVRDSILVAERGRTIEVRGAQDLIVAFAERTALVVSSANLSGVKAVAQETFKHPDRVVLERDVTDCDIQVSGGRLVAIGLAGLRVRLKGRRLVVATKRSFIP
jgi:mannose-1-phosphate guanylyltransferase